MFKNAIARKPGPDFAQGLTTVHLGEPSYELLLEQHRAYLTALNSLGLHITLLEPLQGLPDAYFVEDVAVVTAEIAVITRPGASSRLGEAEHIVSALAKHRELARIQPPGTLDGGDVMLIDKKCYIGISERTNSEGAAQLGTILGQFGLEWIPVPVASGLHLKSDVNYIGKNTVIISEKLAGSAVFADFRQVVVRPKEAHAANTLLVNDHLLTPKGFPHTKAQLLDLGFNLIILDTSEIQKMDGGLSCMSLRF